MYIAAIDKTGTMQITAGFLDMSINEIGELLKDGYPVILDTDKDRLEAMAGQMGLAVKHLE